MTGAHSRTLFGNTTYNNASRFIKEIPQKLIDGLEASREKRRDNLNSWDATTYDSTQSLPFNKKPGAPVQNFRTPNSFMTQTAAAREAVDLSEFKRGAQVEHKKFGFGIITNVEEEGSDLKLDIAFKEAGMKRLMAQFAGLKVIG
jgi:DNA helicase-2/ATP-dependent DNA helicase PcrA